MQVSEDIVRKLLPDAQNHLLHEIFKEFPKIFQKVEKMEFKISPKEANLAKKTFRKEKFTELLMRRYQRRVPRLEFTNKKLYSRLYENLYVEKIDLKVPKRWLPICGKGNFNYQRQLDFPNP